MHGCRDRRLWGEDAGRFVPERWLSSAGDGALASGSWSKALSGMGSNGAYLPFGGGPRNCIGAGFAMMEAKIVLGKILQASVRLLYQTLFVLPATRRPNPRLPSSRRCCITACSCGRLVSWLPSFAVMRARPLSFARGCEISALPRAWRTTERLIRPY